ncbi:hypothetical protein BKA70DRAFT_1127671 [Coprinopsis sp. MPI-PUGE-AT-0042]|nr:hypothetical protein BKA70DRAFT_1127671 [Coprinopsis sp. MPI-PUGE-AT-0042]
MHTLFLGVVRNHFLSVIGTEWKDPKDAEEVLEEAETRHVVASEKHLRRGRTLIMTGEATQTNLSSLTIAALSVLCNEFGIQPLPSSKQKRKRIKKNYILPLLAMHRSRPRPAADPHGVSMQVDGDLEKITVDFEAIDDTPEVHTAMLKTDDLLRIQSLIAKIHRPRSQSPLPLNFGSPSHGKLKANQWATAIEFDLPVALVKVWIIDNKQDEDEEVHQRRVAVVHIHPEKYLDWMREYLEAILAFHPSIDLKPSHHAALHIPLYLRRFGPMRGWWMYFFEQLIGLLQQIKINYKFGEIEATVLKTFSAISQVRTISERPGCPEILGECAKILEAEMQSSSMGFNLASAEYQAATMPTKPRKVLQIDDDVREALPQCALLATSCEEYRFYYIRGQRFSPRHASIPQSLCFFATSSEDLLPGRIRQILAIQGAVYLVIHRFVKREPSFFDDFAEFGAQVWSSNVEPAPVVVPVSSVNSRVYPMNYCDWSPSSAVMKPLIDVR